MMLLRFVVMWLGLCVLGIGIMSVAGYVTNHSPMFRWVGDVGMAFNTSIGFILTGLALIAASLTKPSERERG